MSNDLTIATRELFQRSLVNQVFYKMPFVEELQRRAQITFSGGKFVERLVDTAEIDDLVQMYQTNDSLRDERKDTLAKPRFYWKKGQLPLRYDADDELMNHLAGNEEQLLDLAAHLADKGQVAVKRHLQKMIFNSASATPVSDGDGVSDFQSLVSALDHDSTYGSLSRSISGGTNDYWQGADPADLTMNITSSSQDTATNLTRANLRKWINETDVSHYMEGGDLMILMAPVLWDKLAAEMENRSVYQAGKKQDQGIQSMMFDTHEIVSVPYLQRSSTTKTWVFILNLKYWELQIHKSRNFKVTSFTWQGDMSNGHDYWLSRILFKGNLVCWKPNSSMWLSNVS